MRTFIAESRLDNSPIGHTSLFLYEERNGYAHGLLVWVRCGCGCLWRAHRFRRSACSYFCIGLALTLHRGGMRHSDLECAELLKRDIGHPCYNNGPGRNLALARQARNDTFLQH